MENFTKCYSLRTYIVGRLWFNIYFPRSNIGEQIKIGNRDHAQIFRQVVVWKQSMDDKFAVLFHVAFHLKSMSQRMIKLYSRFPIPFLVGLPGFCAKFWCFDAQKGDFHGFYKWQSKEHAEEYSKLYAMEFMSKRSVPGSIQYEIMGYRGNKFNAYPDIP